MNICLFTEEEIGRPLLADDGRNAHIVRVLRKKEGDSFDAGIIGKSAGKATITTIDENGSIFFDFEPRSDGKPLHPLTLIVGFPRPIQLKRLLRDVAGLGAQKIILTGTELTEKSYLDSNVISGGSAERMLLDGTVQAASTHVPKLVVRRTLSETLRSDCANGTDALVALDNCRATLSLRAWLKTLSDWADERPVVAAIGSERGWTERERDALERAGFALCSMGTRVLRTETAATAACALILDALGCLG